jgi:hypothetical protein
MFLALPEWKAEQQPRINGLRELGRVACFLGRQHVLFPWGKQAGSTSGWQHIRQCKTLGVTLSLRTTSLAVE